MSFIESPRFPESISFGAVGGPGWMTNVVMVVSGAEKRNARWSKMRHAYEVSYAVKTLADFEAVRAHFLSAVGKLNGFRVKDWADYQVAITEGVVSGLTSTTFQLQKKYTSGSNVTLRDIQKPIASGFVLKNSGTTLTLSTDYSLDAATGIVTTVTSKTASNLTWSGEFDVPCRYDIDQLKATIVDKQADGTLLIHAEGIGLVEIRV